MFRLGFQAERVVRLPHFPGIRADNVRKGFFDRETFERVRDALPAHLKPVVTIAYWTGWRKGELLGLTWRQVDLETGAVRLDPGTTKNREGRLVYLPPEALDCLRVWAGQTAEAEHDLGRIIPSVFHRQGSPIRDFYGAWRTACREAGAPGMKFHDFRRTAARNYIRSGVPERVAMSILGHKTRSIFDRYNITDENDLEQAAKRVDDASVGATLGQIEDLRPPVQKVSASNVPESLVPGPGVEPGRAFAQGILSPLCLPVPPPRHVRSASGDDVGGSPLPCLAYGIQVWAPLPSTRSLSANSSTRHGVNLSAPNAGLDTFSKNSAGS